MTLTVINLLVYMFWRLAINRDNMEELLLGLRALSVGAAEQPDTSDVINLVSSDSDENDVITLISSDSDENEVEDVVGVIPVRNSDEHEAEADAAAMTKMQPSDPSLLWTHGENVQQQRWHRDLPEGTQDWMLWLPLSPSGRDLHVVVNKKAQLLHVPPGTGLLLRGDIVHAGAASESANTANFAFHVYLTSNTSTPSSTSLDAVKQQYDEDPSSATQVDGQMIWSETRAENNGVIVAKTFTVSKTVLDEFSQKAVKFAFNKTNWGRWKGLIKHTKTTRYRDADVRNPKSGGRHNAVFSVSEDGFVRDFTNQLLHETNVVNALAGVRVTVAAPMIPTSARLRCCLRLLCASTLSDIHRPTCTNVVDCTLGLRCPHTF